MAYDSQLILLPGGQSVILLLIVGYLAWRFRVWFRLRHIPGPFTASLTNFVRMSWVFTKKAHLIHQELHQKYGDVVRLGPNMVSISDPGSIHTIYPMRKGFVKVGFWSNAPKNIITCLRC